MTTAVSKKGKGKKNGGAKAKPTPPRFSLETPAWADILPVLRENYEIWGAGLTRQAYYDWTWQQLVHPWARKNFQYFVLRMNGTIVSTCKLYTLTATMRGREYKLGGVGAVYTPERHRGAGHAARLLQMLQAHCKDGRYDAVVLYSDIDPAFYETLGYQQFSAWDFHIWLSDPAVEASVMSDPNFFEDMHKHEPELSVVEMSEIELLASHHRRYLSRQAFGIKRSPMYWSFKILRGKYLENHSSLNWPTLELMTLDYGSPSGGYAIFEQGGKILRVLEVVGNEEAQAVLWRQLLRTGLLRRVQLIRGWEGTAPDFVKRLKYAERDWGRPMIFCLNPETESWLDVSPCPLLEFDHF